MKRVLTGPILFVLLFVLTGCSPDLEVAENDTKDTLAKTDLAPYLKDIKYVEGDKLEDEDIYGIDIHANVNDDFTKLPKKEQYLLMQGAVIDLVERHDSAVFCGKEDCYYGEMQLQNGDDIYSMVMEYSPRDLAYEMKINNKVTYTRTDLENDTPSSTSSTTANNTTVPSTSQSGEQFASNGINYKVIFDFMKEQYNIVTNYDENYIPEIHDPLVAEIAAERFGITAKEAGDIYVKVQMDAFN